MKRARGAVKKLVRVVSRDVGLNPVARAVALKVMIAEARKLLILCYSYETGENRQEAILSLAGVLSLVLHTMDRHPLYRTPEYGVMQGALSALRAMSENDFKWRSLDAVAVHTGIRAALAASPLLPSREVQISWVELNRP